MPAEFSYVSRIICMVVIATVTIISALKCIKHLKIQQSAVIKNPDAEVTYEKLKTSFYRLAGVSFVVILYRADNFLRPELTIVYYFATLVAIVIATKVNRIHQELIHIQK